MADDSSKESQASSSPRATRSVSCDDCEMMSLRQAISRASCCHSQRSTHSISSASSPRMTVCQAVRRIGSSLSTVSRPHKSSPASCHSSRNAAPRGKNTSPHSVKVCRLLSRRAMTHRRSRTATHNVSSDGHNEKRLHLRQASLAPRSHDKDPSGVYPDGPSIVMSVEPHSTLMLGRVAGSAAKRMALPSPDRAFALVRPGHPFRWYTSELTDNVAVVPL